MRFYKTPALSSILVLLLLSQQALSQGIQLKAANNRQPLREPVSVSYSNLPTLSGKQFYSIFIFGSGGGPYHDSKPLETLPAGTVSLNPLEKAGSFDIVLYRYNDFSDNKPKQVQRVTFKAVVPDKNSHSSELLTPVVAKTNVRQAPVVGGEVLTNGKEVEAKEVKPKEVKPKEIKETPKPVPPTTKSAKPNGSEKKEITIEKKPVAPLYVLTPAKRYQTDEPIQLQYQLPVLKPEEHYEISISRPQDKFTVNISPAITKNTGLLELKPIYQAGVYEFRVYRAVTNQTNSSQLLFSQPVLVGNPKKDFHGRITCSDRPPGLRSHMVANAPGVNDVASALRVAIPPRYVTGVLDQEDICLEFETIEYFPKSTVKMGTTNYTVFPVLVKYQVIVNDYPNAQAVKHPSGAGKTFQFYKKGPTWLFLESSPK